MNTYSQDLDRIRAIVDFQGNERLDYFGALCKLQTLAMDLANEKFELAMKLAMFELEPVQYKPGWTARNSEEWQEVEA